MIHINELLWDEWNVAHIARHGVTSQEVEEVCRAGGMALQGGKGRLVFIGLTNDGRMLAVILGAEPQAGEGVYYPVTARPAARKERQLYRKFVQGGKI